MTTVGKTVAGADRIRFRRGFRHESKEKCKDEFFAYAVAESFSCCYESLTPTETALGRYREWAV